MKGEQCSPNNNSNRVAARSLENSERLRAEWREIVIKNKSRLYSRSFIAAFHSREAGEKSQNFAEARRRSEKIKNSRKIYKSRRSYRTEGKSAECVSLQQQCVCV